MAIQRGTPITVHGAMYNRTDSGQWILGQSRTRHGHANAVRVPGALDDSVMVHQPTVAKNLAPIKTYPGMRRRNADPLS
jgi:hypothetical protein